MSLKSTLTEIERQVPDDVVLYGAKNDASAVSCNGALIPSCRHGLIRKAPFFRLKWNEDTFSSGPIKRNRQIVQ